MMNAKLSSNHIAFCYVNHEIELRCDAEIYKVQNLLSGYIEDDERRSVCYLSLLWRGYIVKFKSRLALCADVDSLLSAIRFQRQRRGVFNMRAFMFGCSSNVDRILKFSKSI